MRRWDTGEQLPAIRSASITEGKPYPPFHDVQCMVDGEAAAALGEIARARWQAAGCGVTLSNPSAAIAGLSSLLMRRDITAGIARTELETRSAGHREVARLLKPDRIAANRLIYIENQFTSANEIARALARRMASVPSLKVLIVAPKAHSSWFELQAMQGGRRSFSSVRRGRGHDRLRILYPTSGIGFGAAAIMVHSKVMIVDDGFLRVGSANLNNRSLGADSECDVVFEATSNSTRRSFAAYATD